MDSISSQPTPGCGKVSSDLASCCVLKGVEDGAPAATHGPGDVYFNPYEALLLIRMKHIASTALYKGGSAVSSFFGIFPYTLVARSVLRVERSP